MKKLLGIIVLGLMFCNVGFAGLLQGPKPSFQFTEDDKIKESKEGESIIDKSKNFMGMRSKRFAMIVKNNIIQNTYIENPGEYKVSSAEHLLTVL